MLTQMLARLMRTASSTAAEADGNESRDTRAKLAQRPSPLYSIAYIIYRLHRTQPLHHEVQHSYAEALWDKAKLSCHVVQRTLRIVGTVLMRLLCVRHPLGWPLPQEVVVMLMYGILQSRQVPAWRAFFSGVGELQHWVPVVKEQVVTGSCSSWWVRLPPEARPQKPAATINWVYLHGGAFVAGDALMYVGVYAYWMHHLAKQGIDCSILSVEYPLAPEHPYPAAVHASSDVIAWLLHESGETADYVVGGDSAGGNLALAGLALLRGQGRLSRPPLALTLISPAVDLSAGSVFAAQRSISSHFEEGGGAAGAADGAAGGSGSTAAGGSGGSGSGSGGGGSGSGSGGVRQRTPGGTGSSCNGKQELKQQEPQEAGKQQQPQQQREHDLGAAEEHCRMHVQHTAGGGVGPWALLQGLASEALTACRVHVSRAAADAAAAAAWFDYIPADSFADELHCYVPDPRLLINPLVSPAHLADFSGLCSRGMLLVAGGAELMRPDIAAFAAHARASGQVSGAVVYHEEPREPHAFPVMALPCLMRKGLVVPRFVADVALGCCGAGAPDAAAAAAAAGAAVAGTDGGDGGTKTVGGAPQRSDGGGANGVCR